MEMFKFLVCFSIAAESVQTASLELWRVESTNTVRGVLGVLEGPVSEFTALFESLETDYSNSVRLKPSKGRRMMSDVRDTLIQISYRFMSRSAAYLALMLREYYEVAIGFIQDVFTGVTDKEKREMLRIADTAPEYCVLTAFYDWGTIKMDMLEADLLFESLVFLQTVESHNKDLLIRDLKFQLKYYSDRYDSVFAVKKIERPASRFARLPTYNDLEQYQQSLAVLKTKIRDFSQAFCSTWTPFVKSDLLRAETARLNDVQHLSPFVRYTFQYETCLVDFQRIDLMPNNEKNFADYDLHEEENQLNRITGWDCDAIMDSPEYRYQLYKRGAHIPAVPKPVRKPFKDRQAFSLDTLKYGLKRNNYYLNAVIYYNVVADVLLLAAIKEGNKILQAIKSVMVRRCEEKPVKLPVNDMRSMRLTLNAFKSVFDRFVSLIVDKWRINLRRPERKDAFNVRVEVIMALLDRKNDQMTVKQTKKFCAKLRMRLKRMRNIDEYFTKDPSKFETFYFAESMLNIRQLYNYVATDF